MRSILGFAYSGSVSSLLQHYKLCNVSSGTLLHFLLQHVTRCLRIVLGLFVSLSVFCMSLFCSFHSLYCALGRSRFPDLESRSFTLGAARGSSGYIYCIWSPDFCLSIALPSHQLNHALGQAHPHTAPFNTGCLQTIPAHPQTPSRCLDNRNSADKPLGRS
jgi:hypothetical protein